MRSHHFDFQFGHYFYALSIAIVLLLVASLGLAQTTVGTGSIVGTVTDPSGAVVSGAKVTITNIATGQVISLTTNASGAYNSGALIPGRYATRVAMRGFQQSEVSLNVLVGNTANGNVQLQVGQESQVVEVQGAAVQVNTEQAIVQGVLSSEQIENLPVNGRNFLDLAQLEPGVQIQDGQNFDPTKAGYSSISFGGRFGRTARIEVDGVDVSDETVGTTTMDIPASGIQEFQLSQSSLDLSNELTSSGRGQRDHAIGDECDSRRSVWIVSRQFDGGSVADTSRNSGAISAFAIWGTRGRSDQERSFVLFHRRRAYLPA